MKKIKLNKNILKSITFNLIIISVIFSLLLLSGCDFTNIINNENDNKINYENKINVVTTLFPFNEFTKEIGKDNVNTYLLLPPGSDAHSFEPKPSDIIRIEKADIFIYTGEQMEPWVHNILEGINNKNLIIIDASSIIKNKIEHNHDEHEEEHEHTDIEEEYSHEEHEHDEYDPHIWLDFENDIEIINSIKEKLIKLDYENIEFYDNNSNEYIEKLKNLDELFKIKLSDCKHRKFITGGHNSFGYLTNKYNLSYISAFGLSPDSEPTPKTIKSIIDLSRENDIKHIFFEKMVNPKIAETIASEIGSDVLVLNPGHNLLKEELEENKTFIKVMEENLDNLIIGLECK